MADAITKRDMTRLHTRAAVRPESVNVGDRTVEIVWTTGAQGRRYDWSVGEYLEELEVSDAAVRLERLNNGAPLLSAHKSYSLDSVLGKVERAWIENGLGVALVRFSKREDVEAIFQDVVDGILPNISVGYDVHAYEVTNPTEDNALPVWRAVDWEPMELSIVPIGFDDGAKVRSETQHKHETTFKTRAVNTTSDSLAAVPQNQGEPTMTEEQRKAAQEAEKLRQKQIRKLVAGVARNLAEGQAEQLVDDLIDGDVTVEAAQGMVLEAIAQAPVDDVVATDVTDTTGDDVQRAALKTKVMERFAQQSPQTRSGQRIVLTNDSSATDKARDAMLDALLKRIDPKHKESEDSRRFRGFRLIDMARESIRMAGGNPDGMSQREIAVAALGYDRNMIRSAGMHTTSDFPLLLGTAVNRTLRQAYEVATARNWTPLGRQTTLPDFREMSRIALGDLGKLDKVIEHGEYKRKTFGEASESIQLAKYGNIIGITWEGIVNDDLDAFSRVPMMIGGAAAQTEADVVWGLITANAAMGDGYALFSTNHANYTGTGTAISSTSLGIARAMMRKQTTPTGTVMNVTPEFLVVGPDKEQEAYQYTSSQYVPAKPSDINDPRNASLTVIVDARLTGNQWYLFAAPGMSGVDTFEYAYLDGEPGIFTEQREGFDVDGIEIKARLVFGASFIDYRGAYKNVGA